MSTLALREYLESIEGKHAKVAELFAAMRSTELLTTFAQEKGIDLSRTEADALRHVVLKRDSSSALSDRELEQIVGGVTVDAFLRYLR
jgi:hypothetical protein